MAVYSGTVGAVYRSNDSLMVEVKEWTLDLAHNTIETTSFGEEWSEAIPSLRSFSISFTVNVNTNASYDAMIDDIFTDDDFGFKLYADYPNTKYFLGTAKFTGVNPTVSYTGEEVTTFNGTGTDSISFNTS